MTIKLDYNPKSHKLQMLENNARGLDNIQVTEGDNNFFVHWDYNDLLYTGDYFQVSAFLQGMQVQKEYAC